MKMSAARVARIAVIGLSVLALAGCLQSKTVISVNRDGSGTVEETFLMKNEFVEMMAGMSAEAGQEKFSLLDKEELTTKAAAMGEGVVLKSAEPVSNEWGQGYVATFSFPDVSKLRVNQDPSSDLPSQAAMAGGEVQSETPDFVTFSLNRGNPATLQIILPGDQGSGNDTSEQDMNDSGGEEAVSPEDMQGIQEFYKDMKMSVVVKLNGRVVDSNASFRDGNVITLMDIDFNKILENPEQTKKLMASQPDSVLQFEQLMKDVNGIKFETKNQVQVRFR